ncbi:MAG: hypothetical protein FJW39_13645 [Acidobacteria bacterium]|nr:hypothetical protein [Acidobacteriota bacterium]
MKTIPLAALGCALQACYFFMPGSSADDVPKVLGLLLAASIFYMVAVFRSHTSPAWGLTLVFALSHRAAFVTREPFLSDDLYRYRWEARVIEAGGNPYLARPSAAEWQSLRDPTYPRIPAPDFRAGYGPLQELVQAGAYGIARAFSTDPDTQALWMKLPAIVGDLAALAILSRTPLWIVYAWNPLVVTEISWSGHNDGLLLAAIAAAWRWRSSAAAGAAIALKWWPVILIPALARQTGWRRAVWAGVIPFATALPFIPGDPRELWENARFMSGFVGGWRNNDSLFSLMLWAARDDQYLAKYLAFALLAAAVFLFRSYPLERAWISSITALLFLSANCHPWYLTWLMPLLAASPLPPLMLWTGLAALSYSALPDWKINGIWDGTGGVRWAIHAPVLLWLMVRWRKHRMEN